MSDVEHLTDIYLDVAEDTESTTEQQHEQRGSWRLSQETDTRISDTITEMQDRYGLQTQLSDEQLLTLVKAFFEGESDTGIARQLGDASLDKTVTRARLGLHLFRESDTTADFNIDALRDCFAAGNSGAECARQLDIAKSTANRYRRIFAAKDQAERVDNEYYERFRRYCRDETDEDPDFDPDYSPDNGLSDAVAGAGADNPQLQ